MITGVFRLLEAIGRDHEQQQQQPELKTSDPKRGNVNSSRAAAIAAVVALLLLDGKRKNVVVAYAAIEALLALSREHSSFADIKYIGAYLYSYL